MRINPKDLNRRDAHELLMSAVVPRPIALISTVDMNGVNNLAPFSCFTVAGLKPARVCVSIDWKRDGQKKDTLTNIEDCRDFVINVVDEELAPQMNQASGEYPSNVDEFKEVGLTPLSSKMVNAPMVAESPVKMECKVLEILEFGVIPTGGHLVIGEVLLAHLREDLWDGNQIDIYKLKAIGRLGGELYCRTTDIFEMKRPYIFE
ncbi:MAG: flavin reductase family protein [Desulfobacteraceae bacterium]|nr:MAG: flavin reductase family protein [Desulfobacteraceae bacterium]